VALEPCYGERGGNAVRVYTKDGAVHEVEKTIKAMHSSVVRYYNVDVTASRVTYGKYLNRTLNIPVPLSAGSVLISVKMRCPQCVNDGASGYVNALKIKNISKIAGSNDGQVRCMLELESGQAVPCYITYDNIKKRLHDALRVHEQYLNRHLLNRYLGSLQSAVEGLNHRKWHRLKDDFVVLVAEDCCTEYTMLDQD